MKYKVSIFVYAITIILFANSPLNAFSKSGNSNENVYKTISATLCDSLIKANALNPNFVILDVRTPSSWSADHLYGSICRNYYDTDFREQLSVLPRKKIYLLHCQSGSRSAGAFSIMKNLEFSEVYEMSGGISSWKSNALPTTSVIAPKLMSNVAGVLKLKAFKMSYSDTLTITLTNRANDTLRLNSLKLPLDSRFSSNFDLTKKLIGAEDYVFSIYIHSSQIHIDSAKIEIESNGGNLKFSIPFINESSNFQLKKYNEIAIYPNPSNGIVHIKNSSMLLINTIIVQNSNGQVVKKVENANGLSSFDSSILAYGIYNVIFKTNNGEYVCKLAKH